MERYLAIIEVTQKQAYIFGSKKLKDNIARSGLIELITSERYLTEKYGEYFKPENMVYSGGGHTILQYDSCEGAQALIMKYSEDIFRLIPDIDVYTRIRKYDELVNPGENISDLIRELEEKKALRRNSFRQGATGLEKISEETFGPCLVENAETNELLEKCLKKEREIELNGIKYDCPNNEQEFTVETDRRKDNFISVVHIDGNAMGARVKNLHEVILDGKGWDEAASEMAKFSNSIDEDFKSAFNDMLGKVAGWIEDGSLKMEDSRNNADDTRQTGNKILPVRKLILAGDDVCFITSGSIGISCAVEFIKALSQKKNAVDGQGYSCCAGVAMVHTKYPFYRAYNLSEELCSSAKKYGITLASDGSVSAIDWHLEFGQLRNTLSEIRESYITFDGNRLHMRPYVVEAGNAKNVQSYKMIDSYYELHNKLQSGGGLPRSKVKGLRQSLKEGAFLTDFYIRNNNMEKLMENMIQDYSSFIETEDGRKHCLYYDAIETMDQVTVL